jgi:hypothetical protein
MLVPDPDWMDNVCVGSVLWEKRARRCEGWPKCHRCAARAW